MTRGERYIPLFEFFIEGIDLVVEPSGANFTCFVEKVDCEETALATLIMPFLDIGFIRDADSDRPSMVNRISLEILVLIWR